MNRAWQASRRELLYLALAGMDACILTPMALAVSKFAAHFAPERAALACFVVMLIAFNLVRTLDALYPKGIKRHVQRDIALGVLLLWLLLALRLTLYRHYPFLNLKWVGELLSHVGDRKLWPQDVTVIAMMLLFWWRGLKLAGQSLGVDFVGYSFRVGVLTMAVAVALAAQTLNWSVTPFVFGFFFLSLVAMALARAEEVGRWREGVPFPFSVGWLLSIVAAAGAVVLVTIGLIALLTGVNIIQALALLGPVWELLRVATLLVIYALVAILFPLFQFLVGQLGNFFENANIELRPETPTENPFLNPDKYIIQPSTFGPFQPALTVLVVLAGVLLVALAFGRLWQQRNRLGEVETESAWGQREKGGGLAGRARQVLGLFTGRLGLLNRWYTAASIRRIYAQMVATAARCGYPRAASDTPFEHLPTLAEAWPGMEPQLQTITQAYVQIHYGELPETPEELQAICTAWEQLRKA